MAHGKLLRSPHRARAHRAHRHRARRAPCPASTPSSPGSDLPPGEVRHPPRLPGRGGALRRQGAAWSATRWRRWPRSTRRRRSARTELIEVEYEPLRALMSIEDALAHPEVRIHEYGDGPNVHKAVALQFGDVEAAFAGADLVREDVFFFEGNTHLPHGAARGGGPVGRGRQAHALVVHPDAALRAPPARQDPRRAAGAHPRDRGAGRRRLRRQARPVRPRDRRLQALPAHRPPGEDRADARGGVLRPPRPAPRADVDQDRLRARTAPSPACTSAPGSTAAPTAPTAWPPPSTPARSRP